MSEVTDYLEIAEDFFKLDEKDQNPITLAEILQEQVFKGQDEIFEYVQSRTSWFYRMINLFKLYIYKKCT